MKLPNSDKYIEGGLVQDKPFDTNKVEVTHHNKDHYFSRKILKITNASTN